MEHVRLTGKLQVAALQYYFDAVEMLTEALLNAEAARLKTKDEYFRHTAIHDLDVAASF